MARTGGITFSAVVVFLGSAFTILMGAGMVLSAVLLSYVSPGTDVSGDFRYFAIAEAMILLGFGGWGIATGVGLINTRPWARISMIVFSALLLFIALPGALFIAFLPLPGPSDPNLPANFTVMLRAGLVVFFGLLAALSGFWIYFFNKKSVKAQFLREPPVGEPGVADLAGGRLNARPVSITVIGWFLLIGAAMGPLGLLFARNFFPGKDIPLCFLGFFFFGRSAFLIFVARMAAQAVAAVGLLKLKEWGRLLAIWLQVLAILNMGLLFGIPANRAKFQQILQTMDAAMDARMHQAAPFVFPTWLGLVMSLPIPLVILWFLVAGKQAFIAAARQPAGQI